MPSFYEREDVSPNGDNDTGIQKFLNNDPRPIAQRRHRQSKGRVK